MSGEAGSGLEALEPWIEGYLRKLKPSERTKISRKVGIMLRRANSERIRANVEPDGAAMAPRKEGKRRRRRKGRMFAKTGRLRNMRVRAAPDGVELSFLQLVAGTASVHHHGLVDKVDKRIPNSITVRYPARRLLGFSAADREAIMDEVLKWVGS